MMKRRLFIGSSGEHVGICNIIKEAIDTSCADWLDVVIWKGCGVFELNSGTLEVLVRAAREFDYGVFIAAKDDMLFTRGRHKRVTRDNVIFEAGLFMGGLGLNRTFIIASSEVKLPSDFNGATVIMYNGTNPGKEDLEKLVKALKRTKEHYRMDHMFSTSLAYGYYEGFVKPIMRALSEEEEAELSIVVPYNVSELHDRIQQHRGNTGATEVRKNGRLIHLVQDEDCQSYWDIPRSLRTLEGLVEYSKHKSEFGKNTDWNMWMGRELNNFCDVLKTLLDEERLFDEKVHISRL